MRVRGGGETKLLVFLRSWKKLLHQSEQLRDLLFRQPLVTVLDNKADFDVGARTQVHQLQLFGLRQAEGTRRDTELLDGGRCLSRRLRLVLEIAEGGVHNGGQVLQRVAALFAAAAVFQLEHKRVHFVVAEQFRVAALNLHGTGLVRQNPAEMPNDLHARHKDDETPGQTDDGQQEEVEDVIDGTLTV